MDRDNAQWIKDLSSEGVPREQALGDLRVIVFKGLRRALVGWTRTSGREFESLAEDFTQETLLLVLRNLDSFRGSSRFTTWAHKIAVRVALTELRRRRWKDVSLESLMDSGQTSVLIDNANVGMQTRVDQSDALARIRMMMAQELSERQRQALAAVALAGMPLEEVARRMGTNRNALYKLIHDARLRLKRRLAREGLTPAALMNMLDRE